MATDNTSDHQHSVEGTVHPNTVSVLVEYCRCGAGRVATEKGTGEWIANYNFGNVPGIYVPSS